MERALDDLARNASSYELKAKDHADQKALDRLAERLDATEKSLFETQARLGR